MLRVAIPNEFGFEMFGAILTLSEHMDILSRDTLILVQDEKLRKAVEELLTKAAGASSIVTVLIPKTESDQSASEPESRQFTLRRLSA